MSKPWDHLPNANDIDRVLASYNQHRGIRYSTWCRWRNLIGEELRDQAWREAEAKCEELGRLEIWLYPSIPNSVAFLALLAYDDCAHYLDMPSQELTTIALLGVTPAILLLPAVLTFEEIAKSPIDKSPYYIIFDE